MEDSRISINGYGWGHADDAAAHTTAITNTYEPPADANFTATKTWAGGPSANKLAVPLDLYRQSDNMAERERVAGVSPQITGQSPIYTYKWDNLISRDHQGDLYTFTVKERDEDAQGYLTMNGSVYQVSYDADRKDVTNTYQIPKDKNVNATKAWVHGPVDDRPAVWFKLQRRIPGGAWGDVPGAEIQEVPAGLSVAWTGQERTDFNGIAWQYAVVEGTLAEGVFTEGAPENYALSGQGTLNLKNTYTIPKDTEVAYKQWVNGPAQKPTVWFKLQRAVPGGQPADIPAGEAGSAILKLLPGASSVQWAGVEQTDIDGQPYAFSIVEGLLDEDTQGFTPGLPDSYEYTVTAMEGALGVVNTYTSPTTSKTTSKAWAGGGPTPYPDIWLRLERTISPAIGFETVPDAVPVQAVTPEGSTESQPITWNNVALKDDNGVPYVFRVVEDVYDEETGAFAPGAPANYVSNWGEYDMGQGLQQVTNTWQAFDLSVDIIWDGAPAEAYGLPAKTTTLTLYRWHEGKPLSKELLGSVTLDGSDINKEEFGGHVISNGWHVVVSHLPKNDPVSGEPFVYSVEQSGYPAIYTETLSVQEGKDWVFTNTFDKTTVEVFKKYEQTTIRPKVTIVLFQNGVEFDRFELDGELDGSADSGEPYEKQAGLLIWPNLPTRTLGGADALYTVTELIPENYPYQRVITGNATDGFLITNTKNTGRFVAQKTWNIDRGSLPESVTFELWRWVNAAAAASITRKMPAAYDGLMDGTPDAAPVPMA